MWITRSLWNHGVPGSTFSSMALTTVVHLSGVNPMCIGILIARVYFFGIVEILGKGPPRYEKHVENT
jgi:hypothetical protein